MRFIYAVILSFAVFTGLLTVLFNGSAGYRKGLEKHFNDVLSIKYEVDR